MAGSRMNFVFWSLFSCAFLQLCSAQIINCTGESYSVFSDQTIYRISEGSRVSDAETRGCSYSWKHNSIVIAHQTKSSPQLVVNNNVNDLITSKCFDNVTLNRLCKSEGEDYSATCLTNCTLNALQRSQTLKVTVEPPGGDQSSDTKWTNPEIILAVAVVLILVVLVVGAGFLCHKFKLIEKISRKFSQSPNRCIYTAGKKQSVDPKAADLEAGGHK